MIRQKLFEKLINNSNKNDEKNLQLSKISRNRELKSINLSNNISTKKERQLTLITFNDSSLSKTFKKENKIKQINLNNKQKKFKRIINIPALSIPKYKFLKEETGRFNLYNKRDDLIQSPREFSIGFVSKKAKEKFNLINVKKIEELKLKKINKIPSRNNNEKLINDKKINKKKSKLSSLKEELNLINNPQSIIYPLYQFAEDIKNGKNIKYIYKTKVKEYKHEMEKAAIPAFTQVFMLRKQMGIGDENKIATKGFNSNNFYGY